MVLYICCMFVCVCVSPQTHTGRHREEGMDILKEREKEYGQMKKTNVIMLTIGESG